MPLLQELLSRLQAENERLRRDNERFVRLIDSGEWGRGRVAEMVAAGEVMQTGPTWQYLCSTVPRYLHIPSYSV